MKRFWLGVILLAVLLGLGIGSSLMMCRQNEPVSQALFNASQEARAGNWEAALTLETQARQQWQAQWHTVAALADHAPMDEIDSLFSELEVYGLRREPTDFAAAAAKLAALTHAMAEAHALNWWNLM